MKLFIFFIIFLFILLNYLYYNSSKYEYYILKNQKTIVTKKYNSIGVIGGGISGLVFAKNICNNFKTTLFEKNSKLGGNNYSSREFIPMRFSCFLKEHSKPLKNLLHQLKLKEVKVRGNNFLIKKNDKRIKNNKIDLLSFIIFNYIPVLTKLNYSKMLDYSPIKNELNFKNKVVNTHFIPMCGMNLFSNYEDFNKIPASMIALYLETSFKSDWTNVFETIKGGNYLLIEKLIKTIKNKTTLKKNEKIKSVQIRNKKIILNSKYPFDSVILSIQPHQAKNILPKNLEPHQSIFKCFEKIKSYSCVHTYINVFKNSDSSSTLCWEIINNNHYLHIDAYFYTLKNITRPRERIITVWYDNAKNIIPKKYILEQTFTTLSRQIHSKKRILHRLLKKIKTDHSNIHLCNSAYYGFMWHNDAVAIADTLAKSFLVNM